VDEQWDQDRGDVFPLSHPEAETHEAERDKDVADSKRCDRQLRQFVSAISRAADRLAIRSTNPGDDFQIAA